MFKRVINQLIQEGNSVKVCISSKDILENLIISEGWDYVNIFPNGRKINNVPPIVSSFIFFFITVIRLLMLTKNKKYDLFITDDVLGVVGKIKNTPTIHFADDDHHIIPTSKFLFEFATSILAPECTDLGKYNDKIIGFSGYKQSAYLRPKHFKPNKKVLQDFNPFGEKYFLIRLVYLGATHDMGKKGISDDVLSMIVERLIKNGKVFISSERVIPEKFSKYSINIKPEYLLDALSFSEIFISDSQSMSLEAGFLGTPYIRFNSFINKISVLNEIENDYKLGYGISSDNPKKLMDKIDFLLDKKGLKNQWQLKVKNMLDNTIDLSSFMAWFFINYPHSQNIYIKNKNYQQIFK